MVQAGIKKLNIPILLILVGSFVVRFWQLGYSHFYGDETKTFYLDKTISATKFFLSQRKGPIQFVVVWIMEKVTGGHDEFLTRVPFALAGVLSVYVFYSVVVKLFSKQVSIVATSLFAFNGFYIAFSRTVQYQSFLTLFGLSAVLLAYYYFSEDLSIKRRRVYAVFSALFIGLAFLTHYDAIFFFLPLLYIFGIHILDQKRMFNLTNTIKELLLYFFLPLLLVLAPFYLPYIFGGYFESQTESYIGRRLLGSEFDPNHSGYTFWVYNPSFVWIVLLLLIIPYFFRKATWKSQLLNFWLFTTFIVFELIFSNPGTHIHNYFIPLFILIGLGFEELYNFIKAKSLKLGLVLIGSIFGVFLFWVSANTFVPSLNNGYPWHGNSVNKKFHLFLYGFPYNRGWDQIADYFSSLEGVRGVYTNDNDTVAQYYLYGLDYTPPGVNFLPQYYVHVFDNQEFNTADPFDLNVYTKLQDIYVDGQLTSSIYKKTL